jgi:enterochelin esterase-like enzyme
MKTTLKDFTQEEIAQAKKELVEILLEFVDEEDLRITPNQVLKHLLRKEQEDDKA